MGRKQKLPPCLLCGGSLRTEEVVVKQEISSDCDDEDTNFSSKHDFGSFQYTASILLQARKTEVPKSSPGQRWTEDEQSIYKCFLKWFNLEKVLVSKAKNSFKKLTSDLGWNEDTTTEPFPFCGVCRGQLRSLVEMQRKIEQLEATINKGVEKLKEKANCCEKVFKKADIYEKDGRYVRVRKYIVTDFRTRYPNLVRPPPPMQVEAARRSSRRSGKKGNASRKPYFIADVPIVLLSKSDKVRAERRLKREANASKVQDDPGNEEDKEAPMNISTDPPSFLDIDVNHNSPDNDHWDAEPVPDSPAPATFKPKRKKIKKVNLLDSDEIEDDSDSDYDPTAKPRWGQPGWRPAKVKKTNPDGSQEDPENSDNSSSSDDDFNYHEPGGVVTPRIVRHYDADKKTLTYKSLVFHELEPNKFSCSECGAVTPRYAVTRHYNKFHSNLYACKYCDHRAEIGYKLKIHIATVHKGLPPPPQKKYEHKFRSCPICGKSVKSHGFKGHQWSHYSAQEKEDAIARGGKDVPKSVVLRDHQCEECGRSFSRVYLQKHKKLVHGNKEERMELCPECGGTFVGLAEHRKRAHGVGFAETFVCTETDCGRVFGCRKNLTTHVDAVHRNIRPYKCHLCPREFVRQERLQNHLNCHLGIRPWKCVHCNCSFATKRGRQVHVNNYHSGGKVPKRRSYVRGPTVLKNGVKKNDLLKVGRYVPPRELRAKGKDVTACLMAAAAGVAGVVEEGGGEMKMESETQELWNAQMLGLQSGTTVSSSCEHGQVNYN